MEETMYQKLGLAKAEMDENTGDLEDEVSRFRSSVEQLEQLCDQVERVRKAESSVDEAYEGLANLYEDEHDGDTEVVAAALRARDIRVEHAHLVRGWVLDEISATLENSARVVAVVKERNDLVLDYFARKRKFDHVETRAARAKGDPSAKLDESLSERRAKFEHSKDAVRAMTEYLAPLLENFVAAATQCRADALRVLAGTHLVFTRAMADRVDPWAKTVRESPVRELLAQVAAARRGEGPPRPTAPRTEAFKKLVLMLESPPRLATYNPPPKGGGPVASTTRRGSTATRGAVYGAALAAISSPPVEALAALLEALSNNGALDRQGIFRIPGNSDEVDHLKKRLDDACEPPSSVLADADVDDLATLTKMWFRERADNFLEPVLQDALRDASNRCPDDVEFAIAVGDLLDAANTPSTKAAAFCLPLLLGFLARVADNAASNMMTAENLAICFAPNILLRDPDDPAAMIGLQPAISLMERLILNANNITRQRPDHFQQQQPPPKPVRPPPPPPRL
ncbi:hypothetical protein CTAYLR_003690 [Chrysophaeum taylorii]|uniref:Rho-GAP domain-containing protein n=1 Tax=Chrysophaeum taylorii TaxID=2483200 RepID=A0AAD7UMS6_9STRA|nr:hypothetical protein CTAYLR_003690 [Chrysophaeum taylorii]